MSTDIILDLESWVLLMPRTILVLRMNLGRHFAKRMPKELRAGLEKVQDAVTLNRANMRCCQLPRSACRLPQRPGEGTRAREGTSRAARRAAPPTG